MIRQFLPFLTVVSFALFSPANPVLAFCDDDSTAVIEDSERMLFSLKAGDVYQIKDIVDLKGETITLPENCTLQFLGGNFRNGTIALSNTRIENAKALECNVTGSVQNDTIRTKWFSSLDKIDLDYTDKVVLFDKDEILNKGITLENTKNSVFDGQGHTVQNGSFNFIDIGANCQNLEIRNFICIGNGEGAFFSGESSVGEKTHISIHNNKIYNQRLGISLNADLAGKYLHCSVYGNTISDIKGEDPGHGYGIHLANAHYSEIKGNTINNCDRHSIYHAWGTNNIISENTISNHRISVDNPQFRAVVAVFRGSRNVRITKNKFYNNQSVCIHVYDGEGKPEPGNTKYTDQSGIEIIENLFQYDTVLKYNNPIIMLGYNVLPYKEYSLFTKDVEICRNYFSCKNTNITELIRIYQTERIIIRKNVFDIDTKGISAKTNYCRLIALETKYANDGMKINLSVNSNNTIIEGKAPTKMVFMSGLDAFNGVKGCRIVVKSNKFYIGPNQDNNFDLYRNLDYDRKLHSNLKLQ